MKSPEFLAVTAILSCSLVMSCIQTPQASAPNPPTTSYQVGSFELIDSDGSSHQVRGASVTTAFFQSAKITPLLSRGFLQEEYSSSQHQVVMISQHFWQQQLGGSPQVIGTTIHLNGQAVTVIGIMPTSFDVPTGVDIWVPKAG